MTDDLRPHGTVERTCTKCGWSMWFGALHPDATTIPFVCSECRWDTAPRFKGLPDNLERKP